MVVKILTILIAFMLLVGTVSCNGGTFDMVRKSIVQVWNPSVSNGGLGELESIGIVVGDGSQVLTLLDYEDYSPGNLIIFTQNHQQYNAIVEAIDPRTGITLLKLEGVRLTAATLGNSNIPAYEQKVLIWGWSDSDQPEPTRYVVTASANQAPRPLFFSIYGFAPYTPGMVVTDRRGNILGFETTFHERLSINIGPPGTRPPVASVESARELLSSGCQEPLADGPAHSAIASRGLLIGNFAGILSTTSDYEKMTIALQDLFRNVGQPIATDDLGPPSNTLYRPIDGTMLVVVYPWPVALKGVDGQVLAQAKWVGIQWDRSEGKPNRLIYGDVAYTIKGGFVIVGDLTSLQQSVPPVR